MATMCPLCVQFDGADTAATVKNLDGGRAMSVACPRCGVFEISGVEYVKDGADESTRLRLSALARKRTRERGERLVISA